jgi:hypothetical protein
MKKWIKRLFITVSALLIVLIAALFVMRYFAGDHPFDDRNFDAAVWRSFNNDRNPDNPRGQMFDDLCNNHLRKGLSKQKVMGMLDPPDEKSEMNFLSYNLGMWSGYRMDYDTLDLVFDGEGNLVKFYRVQH